VALARVEVRSLMAGIARSNRPAIEGTIIGLIFGLIDIHSTSDDWFSPVLAYLIAGLALGMIHSGRAWQAWPPLGWCFYLMHRGAIAYGYRPPYVEANGAAAIRSLFVLWPAGIGIAIGAFLRFGFSTLDWATRRKDPPINPGGVKRENQPPSESVNVPYAAQLIPPSTKSKPTRPKRSTVAKMMLLVAWIGICLATARALLHSEPMLGFGTVYSEQFSERAFNSVRVGMNRGQVEQTIGRPLRKVPWGSASQEMWYYSDQPDPTANFWRRWVLFENGKVTWIANDFWVD
jgi:hypothetical protein